MADGFDDERAVFGGFDASVTTDLGRERDKAMGRGGWNLG